MPDFPVDIESNLLDSNRSQKIKFQVRNATFHADLPDPYGQQPVRTNLGVLSTGGLGTGLTWLANAGGYSASEWTVTVDSVDGMVTGTNANASPATVTSMHVSIKKANSNIAVAVTFT